MRCPNCGLIITDEKPLCGPWPQECLEERCTYYTHYLRHGPPDLGHTTFHRAETECAQVQENCEAWEREHSGHLPVALAAMCLRLEKEVRA